MPSIKNSIWAILADINPNRYEVDERSHFLTKNRKINPFVVKSLLESNCKRFRQSAIRENFNLKPKSQLKKTLSTNGGNYTHHYIEVKENLLAVSFFYVWTIFEHQVIDMYASQKIPRFSQSSQARTRFQARSGPPTSICINKLHWNLSKHNYYSIRSRTSKES